MFPENADDDWNPQPLLQALAAAGYHASNFRPADRDGGSYVAKKPSLPLDHALQLFAYGHELPEAAVRSVLDGSTDPLLELGLLVRESGGLRSAVRLDPDGDSVFASDHPDRLATKAGDFTMGIGRSTRLLTALAPTHPGLRTLDLCTGAGWIALRLAEAGCTVTATDLSPRALAFARFNARLAGCEEIEFLQGSGLAPVEGRRFDLILANPPFVISPESTYTFRDSGTAGTSFCESLARRLPDHLADDGLAIMLLSWFDDGNEARAEGPLDWLESHPDCGRWLFRNVTQSPEEYAAQWLKDSAAGQAPAPADLRRWTDHFHSIGAARLHTGFLVVHRGTGPGWTRSDARRIDHISKHAGGDIRRVVEGESWLARHRPSIDTLLETHFGVPDGLRTESVATLEDDWRPLSIRLISPARLAYDGNVDAHLLDLLARCRRGEPPSTVLSSIAAAPQLPAPEDLRERLAGLIRELIRHGLLLPPAA